MTISFTVPDEKVQRVVDAMKGLYEIPKDEEGVPLFTDNQWAKEVIRKFIVQQVARWEQMKAQRAIKYTLDETIAQ